MKVYSEPGSDIEYVIHTETFDVPEHWVEMKEPRPDEPAYATQEGVWQLGISAAAKARLFSDASSQRARLISEASNKIDTLKDRIDAGQERMEELRGWQAYRIALDDIDINKAPDIDWPNIPAIVD
ncbi:TPA: tail fiber assembly protein [Yersinia enterocolitica]|nr:tail fiber assembly protein [Yersinia enterocolitica]HDL7691801.1 tail fiber assembly protein [Yersinia enterocolitica]HDL7811745.1 tail fiber assembly protein [Yersinia enterocolitica]